MARTVLIADDIPYVRTVLAALLVEAGFQVVGEAKDGNEAFEMYFKLRPDLITMDIVMPNFSGVEATRKIVKADKEAKVVIITAMGQEQLVMEAINAGARDYLLKPFRAEEVLRTIHRVMGPEEATTRGGKESKSAGA